MSQRTVQCFVGQDTLELSRRKRVNKFLAVINLLSIGLHGLHLIGNKAQPQTQGREERMTEQELYARLDQLGMGRIVRFHEIAVCPSGGSPMYAAIRRVVSAGGVA